MLNRRNASPSSRMDYISDKATFAAVMFARKLIREGMSPGLANAKAAKYYKVAVSAVAKYVGQHASRTKQARSAW